jgi:putative ABC transport system permease protein
MAIGALAIAAAGITLGTLLALATLLPFDSALGAPGLPAGPPWIYLAVTTAAGLVTVGAARLATRLVNTDPGAPGGALAS